MIAPHIFLLGLLQASPAGPPTIDVAVTVSPKGPGGSESIVARVANLGHANIKVYQASLPWAQSGFEITALPQRNCAVGRPIEAQYTLSNPSDQIVTIRPGQTIEGQVALSIRLPDAQPIRNKCDILIFWSYQLVQVNGIRLQRVGGWLLLPKSAANR